MLEERTHYLVVFDHNGRAGNTVVFVDGPLTAATIGEIERGIARSLGLPLPTRPALGVAVIAPVIVTNVVRLEG